MRDYKPAPEIHCLRCGKSRADEPHGHCRTWGKSWPRHLWGPDHGDCETAGYCACDEGTCRISELETEVERLRLTCESRAAARAQYLEEKLAAEAKLAAIEGLPQLRVAIRSYERAGCIEMRPVIEWSAVQAILRGESEDSGDEP